jgi:hypothetical protein
VKPDATTFAMNTPVTSGGAYAITINTQPAGETCAVSSESGSDGNFYGLTINGGVDDVGAIFKSVPH